jgi:hypothetical protein
MLRSRLTLTNIALVVALVLALGGTSAYAANTILSADIVDGEVKTVDLGPAAVTNAKLADDAVGSHKITDGQVKSVDIDQAAVTSEKVADNTLTGADIDESTLNLPASGNAPVSNRVLAAVGSSGQTLFSLPGLGEVRVRACNGKSTGTLLVNNTSGYLDVSTDVDTSVSGHFDVYHLAPGETTDVDIEGYQRVTYQVGAGFLPGKVATVMVTGWLSSSYCKFQGMAFVK